MLIQNVSFSYPNNNKVILREVNLELISGKSYALIGPTGEGKSTLAMLMAGLIAPSAGTISYQGQELKDMTQDYISGRIGYILQDPYLYQGTILDNIIYGNPRFMNNYIFDDYARTLAFYDNKTDNSHLQEPILELLQLKNLSHLLDRFPEGLTTQVSNNSENLSLGQKQVINFLRVILREPEFLILDEATANLDTITEQQLQDILNNLPKTTTKVIIAHRLNTIKDVDYKYQVLGGTVSEIIDMDLTTSV
jgi:ATP-binding cassette, subfamily B, bacterial